MIAPPRDIRYNADRIQEILSEATKGLNNL
ncbi:hypothetical protein PAXY110619_19760 [Paenibacillus xylanexedens]|uniref:Uncharacterized protein n=1 Tax=Paenibacillus xylanexedens TaxID=528191 RepID=A0ABS4RUQ1_PAEXY|nr:hypothetical protein [Paenibacillus xylanexedens]